jgi:hypothetical protein
MSDEDCNRALLRFFYEELWIKGNVEMIPGLLAEDFVDHHALSGTPPGREGRSIGQAEESRGVAGRLEHVFEVVRNPKTGEPYTNAVVARMTLGDLSEEDVQGIRSGAISDPSVGQVAALGAPSVWSPPYSGIEGTVATR